MTCKTFTNRSANELHPSALLQLQEQHYIVPCLSLRSWFSLNFMPMCKPNHLDADHQEPRQVSIKESSNFTDISNALSKQSGLPPSWAPDRLHTAEASCSRPRKCSAAVPSASLPCSFHGCVGTRRRLHPQPQHPPVPGRRFPRAVPGTHVCAERRAVPAGGAEEAPAGLRYTAPGEIFQSTPPKAWP